MKLAGKVVAITGAANGLGRALAQDFSAHEANITAIDIDKSGLAKLQNELPDIVTIAANVSDHPELKRAFDETLKVQGQIDIWINNAGIIGHEGSSLDQDIKQVNEVFAINTLALIDGSIMAAKYFAGRPDSWIINMLSTAGLGIRPERAVYSASKHAGHGFTQGLKQELKGTVKVLGVYPDGTQTELFGEDRPDNYDEFMKPQRVAKRIVTAVIADRDKDLVIKR